MNEEEDGHCRVLPIAVDLSRHACRLGDPALRSDRAKRDAQLRLEIRRVWAENFEVYGARKVWRQLNREEIEVARCTVERPMAEIGLVGAVRGKSVKTTWPDPAVRPLAQPRGGRVRHPRMG